MALVLSGTDGVKDNSGAIVLETAKTATGTSVDITGIPSWVKRITVLVSGVSGATNNWQLGLVLGDSGGFETSGYVGSAGRGSATAWVTAVSNTAYFDLQGAVVAPADTIRGVATLSLLGSNTWVLNSTLSPSNTTVHIASGEKTLSDTLTQVRVSMISGTAFDAGTINIIYE